MSDAELLKRYADTGCEASFTELVKRYVDLVHSAAIRQVGGDAALAQDVTQTVFIDLARKASSISSRTILSGWLYTSTRFAAAKAVRSEQRWHAREREAFTMQELTGPAASDKEWIELRPVLDEAMHGLSERDRNAVLLRYFEGRQLAEVGAQLGMSEDAARMRVTRALEKLRHLLAKRGVAASAAGLAGLLASQTITAAPAGMIGTIAASAVANAAATGAGTTLTLFKIIAMTKLKLGVITAIVIAGLATPLLLQHQTNLKISEENELVRQQNIQLGEKVSALAADNLRLSNLVALAAAAPSAQNGASNELLRLRSEVGRLRASARQSANNSDSGNDPAMEASLKVWASRVTQLKQRLEQMPDKKIPELQLLTDKDWFDAAKGLKQLQTDDDYRQAFSDLRRNVKNEFARMLQQALRGFAQANGGQLPADMSQLKPYFQKPVDDAMLARYSLLQSGKATEVPSGQYVIAETALPVDDEYDTVHRLTMAGINTSTFNRIEEIVKQAGTKFAEANNGILPTQPSQLEPYLKEPLDPSKIQKVLNKVPPGVTTLDQLNAAIK
jgi:RNA polymerase sigma factor (sigma-70 family)